MYDSYSLIRLRNRVALEGEELVAHRYRKGAVQMVAQSDLNRWRAATSVSISPARGAAETRSAPQNGKSWESLCNLFRDFLRYYGFNSLFTSQPKRSYSEPEPIVEISDDALLRVYEISPAWQQRYSLQGTEEALCVPVIQTADHTEQALCFGNGVVISWQSLREGQKIKVLRHSWTESLEEELNPARARS